jgi:16S rRNA processing protein RimM
MAGPRVCLGQIGAPHGVRGEVHLHSFTAQPAAIASYGPLETDDGRIVTIEKLRPGKHGFLATLAGVADRSAAQGLVNAKLHVPRERLPEPQAEDEYYYADLIGLRAIDRAGKERGTVIAVHNFGAGDIIEVEPSHGGDTELLPFDAATVPEVDLAHGRLVVEAPTSDTGATDNATSDHAKPALPTRPTAKRSGNER